MHIYDDVVTQDYLSEEQIRKTTLRWEMADNLGTLDGCRKWIAGTRYCTIGSSRILMADWSHKPISDVRIGDVIVGWELRNGKRMLRPAKVVNRGVHFQQPVNRYGLSNGQSVTCTDDHRWWRGAHGGGPEYAPLGLPAHVRKDRTLKGNKPPHGRIMHLRQLLVPTATSADRDASWLAGFYDGEGSFNPNSPQHPSGAICITQTTHNQVQIDETRSVLTRLGFVWSEYWVPAKGRERMTSDRCVFSINGGWRERYRFLTQVAPVRKSKIAESLFGQLATEKIRLTSIDDAGLADVHWLETETGNYVVEGFCSSNSFADTYGIIMERNAAKPRIYPATDDGTLKGKLVLLSDKRWGEIQRTQKSTISAQMLLNPLAGNEATFDMQWLKTFEVFPSIMNVYILCDPSKGSNSTSDRTAIAVVGVDTAANKYLIDGYRHRMKLSQRWTYLKQLEEKWRNHPGVQNVRVGYEQYGMQSDLETIQENMLREKRFFNIEELGSPRQGPKAKNNRIERLEPDIRSGRFKFPAAVWHPDFNGTMGYCYWTVWTEEDQKIDDEQQRIAGTNKACPFNVGQIVHRPARGLTRVQRGCESTEQAYRIVRALKRKDEDGNVYDVTRGCIEEAQRHPFAAYDDFIDALSRIYDFEAIAPIQYETGSTEPIGDHSFDDGSHLGSHLDS
jgi:hypothetical protein